MTKTITKFLKVCKEVNKANFEGDIMTKKEVIINGKKVKVLVPPSMLEGKEE